MTAFLISVVELVILIRRSLLVHPTIDLFVDNQSRSLVDPFNPTGIGLELR